MQTIRAKFDQNSAIGSLGLKETAHPIFTFFAISLWRFELDSTDIYRSMGFRTLFLAGQQMVNVGWFESVLDNLY